MTDAHLFVIGILLAWMAGIRAYLTVFGVGLAGLLGWVELPPALQATQSWWVLGTSGGMLRLQPGSSGRKRYWSRSPRGMPSIDRTVGGTPVGT